MHTYIGTTTTVNWYYDTVSTVDMWGSHNRIPYEEPVRYRPPKLSNRLVVQRLAKLELPWPCAIASKPGPPPVSTELAAKSAKVTIERLPMGVRVRPRVRLHARDSVPSRTRRKLRVWERKPPTITGIGI